MAQILSPRDQLSSQFSVKIQNLAPTRKQHNNAGRQQNAFAFVADRSGSAAANVWFEKGKKILSLDAYYIDITFECNVAAMEDWARKNKIPIIDAAAGGCSVAPGDIVKVCT